MEGRFQGEENDMRFLLRLQRLLALLQLLERRQEPLSVLVGLRLTGRGVLMARRDLALSVVGSVHILLIPLEHRSASDSHQ